MTHNIAEIDATSLCAAQSGLEAAVLVDVREGWEVAQGALPNAVHVPLTSLGTGQAALTALPADKATPIVTYCHHGVRSMRAAAYLVAQGYTHVSSLKGGIDAWATDVDASVGRY